MKWEAVVIRRWKRTAFYLNNLRIALKAMWSVIAIGKVKRYNSMFCHTRYVYFS